LDVSVEITIDKPLSTVAAYAADPMNARHWVSAVSGARWEGAAEIAKGSKVIFDSTVAGQGAEYLWEIAEYEPEQRMVLRTSSGPFPIERTYTWAAKGGKTAMTVQTTGSPSLKQRTKDPLMTRTLRQTTTEDLGALKGMLEGHPVG
jgi:hypothetical protein